MLQFSLRTLLLAISLMAVGFGIYERWYYRLDHLVELIHQSLEEKEYDRAEDLADEARRRYPDSDVAMAVFWKARFIKLLQTDLSRFPEHSSYLEPVSKLTFASSTFVDFVA